MRPALLLLLAFALPGCAGLDQNACRNADWYDLGFRDAIFGLTRQDLVYSAQCERYGIKVDVVRYTEGWREGDFQADYRNGPGD